MSSELCYIIHKYTFKTTIIEYRVTIHEAYLCAIPQVNCRQNRGLKSLTHE